MMQPHPHPLRNYTTYVFSLTLRRTFPFFLIDPSPDHVCVTFYGVEIKLLLSQCLSIENIETCFIPFVTDLWVRARLRARKVVHPRCTVVQSNAKGMALLVHT